MASLPRKLSVERLPVEGKTVLVRVDFNVPLEESAGGVRSVGDDTRIRASLPTIRHLIGRGAKVVLVSHLGRPDGQADPKLSLRPVSLRLAELLAQPVAFCPEVIGPKAEAAAKALAPGQVLLLENVRFHKEEEKNEPGFAQALARLGDAYVSDAFGTVHRAHASTAGVAKLFPQAACGFLIAKELEFLGQALAAPVHPYVAVLGGAKVGDKIPVIRSLLERADTLLIGGAMAYTFLKAQGHGIGASLLDEPHLKLAGELLQEAQAKGRRLLLPSDHLVSPQAGFPPPSKPGKPAKPGLDSRAEPSGVDIAAGKVGLDIGPDTIRRYQDEVRKAKLVVWNGPMGMFELPRFAAGTMAIAQVMADATRAGAITVIGGGDSVAAANEAGVADRISHMSTGGGASLEFLEGRTLPGIAVLTDA
jgi:phosphoglycerate kinase